LKLQITGMMKSNFVTNYTLHCCTCYNTMQLLEKQETSQRACQKYICKCHCSVW